METPLKIQEKSGRQISSAHTPGPWKAVDLRSQQNGKFKIRSTVAGVSHFDIANVMVGSGYVRTDAEPYCEANARLIAAAPELLEALRRVSDSVWEPDKWRKDVNDAIAKAEGK